MMEDIKELNEIKAKVNTLREVSLDIENAFEHYETLVLSNFKILADLITENTQRMNKLYKRIEKIEAKNIKEEKAECSGVKKPETPTIILEEINKNSFKEENRKKAKAKEIKKASSTREIRIEVPKKTVSFKTVEIQDKINNNSISSPETTPVSKVDGVYSDQQYWPEENNYSANNHVIFSIPEFAHRHPFAYTSASEEKWIKHYSSRHRILLVGDGDFSFSAALARAFGFASNMTSTSLDSEAFLEKHYQNARANIEELRNRSCKVIHGIDATKMANHALLGHLRFDRIIYNFPHAGLILKELPREAQLERHRELVSQFLKNAKEMITENGEIHISHKTNGFHGEWKLEMVASSHRLRLIEAVDFNLLDYPGYNTKYGFGGDKNFDCYPSKTYKFGHKTGVRISY